MRFAGVVVDRRVLQLHHAVLRLVHVPHADVPLERVAHVRQRIDERAAVAHRELRPVGHFGKPHPDERHAVLVPRVDLVRDDVPQLVDERHVASVIVVEVVVGEAVCVVRTDVDQHREVRERLRSRVARHRERKEALEVFHHPEDVRAVVVELRVGRTDVPIALDTMRCDRARDDVRCRIIVANGAELVIVGRSACKPADGFREAVAKGLVLRKDLPARLCLAIRPNLAQHVAPGRAAERENFAAHDGEIIRDLRKTRFAGIRRPRNRQPGASREGARHGFRRICFVLIVADGAELVAVFRGKIQSRDGDLESVAGDKPVRERRPVLRLACACRPDLALDGA